MRTIFAEYNSWQKMLADLQLFWFQMIHNF